MAAKKTVVANMTVEAGTPAKPVTIARGDTFEIDGDDPENLIGRGIVSPVSGPSRVESLSPSSNPVQIPEGWEDFKADELVALARKLGATSEVTGKDDALAFISAQEAARAANA